MRYRLGHWFLLPLLCFGCIKRELPADGAEDPSASSAGGRHADLDKLSRTAVLGQRGIHEFELQGSAKDKVEVSVVPVDGQPFKEALRAHIKEASGSEWSVQVQARTTAPVAKGDALLATFYVRYVEPQADGKAETQFVFEKSEGPYTKSITYPLFLGNEWRKIQVRFTSAEDYGPGAAQMIFRLGYQPEVIEIGGVTVENFGKQVKVRQLPSTELADLKFKPKPVIEPLPPAEQGGSLSFEVATTQVISEISPYVYGINSQKIADTGTTVRRMGGNRQSAYNWELNASSAGSDWQHLNDDWPCTNLGYKNCDEPGGQFTSFVKENDQANVESLVVVPIIDYVSADKDGSVNEADAAPSKRYLRSYAKKPGAYALKPDLKDGAVYQDEFVNFLVHAFGRADKGGVKFYALDNEPALWPHTHPRVHKQPATYKEVIERTEATAEQITRIDPSAQVFGGVMFGWSEFMSLSSAPDHKEHNQKYGTYVDFFLAKLKELEQKHGRRLVHVLDVHWYPEVRGTQRITLNDASLKTIAARLEAPRSFWDPDYVEKSWITEETGKPIRFFPWLKERIAERYPGTKIAMTEYNFGTGDHVSGGLAQVDVLGIFGREGVYMANYWGNGAGVGELPKYIAAAFRLYRNYDGKGGAFGETALMAKPESWDKASIYAATRKDGKLTMVVINKDLKTNVAGKIQLSGGKNYVACSPYLLDSSGPDIKPLPKLKVTGNTIEHPLPRLSATLFVCDPG